MRNFNPLEIYKPFIFLVLLSLFTLILNFSIALNYFFFRFYKLYVYLFPRADVSGYQPRC